jgi:hypothetical protein
MRQTTAALVREFWYEGRWGLLIGVSAMTGLPALVYGTLLLAGGGTIGIAGTTRVILFHSFLMINIVICLLAVLRVQCDPHLAFPQRLYALPIPTRQLVHVKLLLGMVTAAAMYLVTALTLNTVLGMFDASWPLWGPAFLFAAAAVCALAINWATAHQQLLQLSLLGGAFLLLCIRLIERLVISEQGSRGTRIGFLDSMTAWWTPNYWESLAMLLCVVVAYGAARVAVEGDRQGERLDWPALRRWLDRPARQELRPAAAFRSASSAAFWLEWRQKGWALPATVVTLLTGVALCTLLGILPLETGIVTLGSLSMQLPILLAPFFALWLGDVRTPGALRQPQCATFRATLPVTDAALSGALLKNAAASLFATWCISLLTLLSIPAIMLALHRLGLSDEAGQLWEEVSRHLVVESWWSYAVQGIFLVSISWAITGLCLSLPLIGRPWVLVTVLLSIFGGLLLYLLSIVFLIPQHSAGTFAAWVAGVLATSCVVGTIWAFVAACRRNVIKTRTALTAFAAWGTVVAIAFTRVPTQSVPFSSWSDWLILAVLITLPLAPLATAPLALSWNRHR